jgi:hypothetical protein
MYFVWLNGVANRQTLKTGWIDRSTLPVYQTEYGQGRDNFATATNGFYHQPVFNSSGNNVLVVKTNYDEAWGPAYDANLSVYTWESFTPNSPNYGKATPWVAADHNDPLAYFETPFSTITSLTLNGGSEQSGYKIGYVFDDTDGITPNSLIRKHILNFGWTQELAKSVRLDASLNYSNTAARNRSTYDYHATTTPNSSRIERRKEVYPLPGTTVPIHGFGKITTICCSITIKQQASYP